MADSAPFVNSVNSPLSLAALRRGDRAVINAVSAAPELLPRLAALGFHVGHVVEVLRRAPFAGPLHIRLGTTDVVIRREDAAHILVVA